MTRALVAAAVGLFAVLAVPLAGADTVVDSKVTAAKGDDGTVTATIEVINTGAAPVQFHPTTVPAVGRCLLTADPASAAGSRSTAVTVTIPATCFADASTPIGVDLDGVGRGRPLPATVVAPPTDEASDWAPLWWGVFIGLLAGIAVGLWGYTVHQAAEQKAGSEKALTDRAAAYGAVKGIVDARMAGLPPPALSWKPALDPPDYGLTTTLGHLEAGWSFKDSWVSNITVASTALIALLTSTDALTALLGEKPAAALGVMTTAGLVSAALIGVANTALKLVGPKVSDVTVGGLILATAIVVFGAVLQVVTVALVVLAALGVGVAGLAALLLAVVVVGVLTAYALRSLAQAVGEGFTDALPSIPDTSLTDWAAADGWEKRVVAARIHSTYSAWLVGPGVTASGDGTLVEDDLEMALPAPPDWTTVAPAGARTRRSALL